MRPGAEWEPAAPRRGRRTRHAVVLAVAAAAVAPVLLARDVSDPGLPVEPRPADEEPRAGVDLDPSPAEVRTSDRDPPPDEVRTSDGAWRDLPFAPITARTGHTLVWTGVCTRAHRPPECGEVLVWGGVGRDGPLVDGAAYEPVTDAWRVLPDAPRGRDPLIPVAWTGSAPGTPWLGGLGGEVVVWGASARDRHLAGAGAEPRGAAHDPLADTWRTLPEAPIAPRVGHTLSWNGTEVVVWGGRTPRASGDPEPLADGAAYDPATDGWRTLPDAPIAARANHAAVAAGDGSVIIFGGQGGDGRQPLADGAVYDAATDRWRLIEPLPDGVAPLDALDQPALAWLRDGARGAVYVLAPVRERSTDDPGLLAYDLDEESWEIVDADLLGLRSDVYAGVLTGGKELVVWGGERPITGGRLTLTDGARLSAAEGLWARIPEAPTGLGAAAVSTGFQLVVWGGPGPAAPGRLGARFDPALPSSREPTLAPLEAGVSWQPGFRRGTWHTSRRLRVPADGEALRLEITTSGSAEAEPRLMAGTGGEPIVDLAPAEEDCGSAERGRRCRFTFTDLPQRPTASWNLVLTVRAETGNADVLVEVR